MMRIFEFEGCGGRGGGSSRLDADAKPFPEGPSGPYLWFLIPKQPLRSDNREYLDHVGLTTKTIRPHETLACNTYGT